MMEGAAPEVCPGHYSTGVAARPPQSLQERDDERPVMLIGSDVTMG